MDPISKEELDHLVTASETKAVEFKESLSLQDDDEMLRQLTAFANRNGGTLLLGIRNDGTYEGASFAPGEEVSRILHLARDRTSPIVEFEPREYRGPDGTVLCLKVNRRTGVPIAIVRRAGHEIQSRRYYIRTENGVRLVDDKTLEWLFGHQGDPVISERFTATLAYAREDISLSGLAIWPTIGQSGSIAMFQALTEDQKRTIKDDEVKRMTKFLAETIPYAILARLSWIYPNSWRVEVYRSGDGTTRYRALDGESERFPMIELERPGPGTLLHSLAYDPINALQPLRTICLPPGSTLSLHIDSSSEHHSSATITISKLGVFTTSIRIVPSRWSVGLPAGHPVAADDVRSAISRQQAYAQVSVDIDFRTDFNFPDSANEELEEHYAWANQLIAEIRNEWDWEIRAVSQELQILISIQRDVKRMLKNSEDESNG